MLDSHTKGYFYGLTAFFLWGILPIYWEMLNFISAFEVLLHRIIWSFFILIFILYIQKNLTLFIALLKEKKELFLHSISALLISFNWSVFIWGVLNDYVIETSLGYFISPIFSLFLGVIIFKEHLRKIQWLVVFIIFISLVYLTFIYGRIPWVALALSISWGIYSVFKKLSSVNSIQALTLETLILLIPAICILFILNQYTPTQVLNSSITNLLLLISCGIITVLPLGLFIAGVRLIELSTISLMQYISPSLTFLIGIYYFEEPFNINKLIGFCIVWSALLIFLIEKYAHQQKNKKFKAIYK